MTSEQITLSKISSMIYDHAVKDPNVLGEVLLDYTFVDERTPSENKMSPELQAICSRNWTVHVICEH
jgi:hypothetical protein